MTHDEVQVETPDGHCPTHVLHPDGAGPWPAVVVYMDAIGVRPAMLEIAERIAREGYFVLLPNLFYRVEFDPAKAVNLFSDPEVRADVFTRVVPSASPANVVRHTEALLGFLATQDRVRPGPVGVVGYCMGGRLAMYVAGHFGARVAAAASYHASGLATDSPESPHRLAPNLRARVYVAGASEDAGFDDAQKARLEQALTDAGVDHVVETYNARHGFVMRDTPAYDEAATERHWRTLLPLFRETLKPGEAA